MAVHCLPLFNSSNNIQLLESNQDTQQDRGKISASLPRRLVQPYCYAAEGSTSAPFPLLNDRCCGLYMHEQVAVFSGKSGSNKEASSAANPT